MSKAEHRNHPDRTELEQMSTAGLEELLLQDFRAREHGDADMDRLYQAARVLADRDPDSGGTADQAWERFEENYLPFASALSEDGGMPSSDAAPGRRYPLWRRGLHVAGVAAVLCALLLSISLTAAAGGYDLWRMLASWTDEQLRLDPGQIIPMGREDIHIPEEPGEYADLQEALEACGLIRPVAPRRLPEGFEPSVLEMEDMSYDGHVLFSAIYCRGEDNLAVFIDIFLDDGQTGSGWTTNFQKDDEDPIPYEAGGITHLLTTNAGRHSAVWASGPAECAISGDITMEELERMIDSIYQ